MPVMTSLKRVFWNPAQFFSSTSRELLSSLALKAFFQCRRLKVMSASLTVCTEIWRSKKELFESSIKFIQLPFLYKCWWSLLTSLFSHRLDFNVDLACFWDNHFMQKEPVAVRVERRRKIIKLMKNVMQWHH